MSAALVEDEYGEVISLDELARLCAADPMTGNALAGFAWLEPDALSTQAARVDTLIGLEHVIRWAQARQQQTIASLQAHALESADPLDKSGKNWVREDIACALSIPTMHANAVLTVAAALVGQFPATLAALEDGLISLRHAQDLVDATLALDPKL